MVAALTTQNITKGFGAGQGRVSILRGISLDIPQGETVILVGPSGSGKTTLLSILGCILTPDKGEVTSLGHRVSSWRPEKLAAFRRAYFGFVFQTFNLFPTLTALDNVCLGLTMRGATLWAARQRGNALLDQMHLGERARLRPAQLSSGECQRVAIARALAHEPRILFADEPTASLDSANGLSVMDILSNMVRSRFMTLVVVSHDQRIFPFANRILCLEDGRIVPEAQAQTASVKTSVKSWKERVA